VDDSEDDDLIAGLDLVEDAGGVRRVSVYTPNSPYLCIQEVTHPKRTKERISRGFGTLYVGYISIQTGPALGSYFDANPHVRAMAIPLPK
jgi:hypothetical protein